MISLETARNTILESLSPVSATEVVPLLEAAGRVCASDVYAPSNLPAFDNAAVDGYAVQSTDLRKASREEPVCLRQAFTVSAGETPTSPVLSGTCARILTGAVVPPGADAVVMQEDVRVDGAAVCFTDRVAPWEAVRLAGEDLRQGAAVVQTGERLRPAHAGLLAATGNATISVFRRPRVALLATGNELVEPGVPLAPGRIHDSNRVMLAVQAMVDGVSVVSTKSVGDDLEGIMAGLREAAQIADVVVSTGGVSVGSMDFVKAALNALGGKIEFWRVAMKPGKPFAWGRLGDAHWFGLPGNPVSAFVTWWVLVRPALRRLMGMKDPHGRRAHGRLGGPVRNASERRHLMRVTLDTDATVHPAGTQASHIQSSLAAATALMDVPPGAAWEAGREVMVELLE
jgi:molybdopterin molybdotransferase